MRITAILLRQHIGRAFNNKWKYMRKQKVLDLGVPRLLRDKNVEIVEATEFVKEPVKREMFVMPEPYSSNRKLPEPTESPNWHEEQVYHMHKDTKLIEGIPQIQVLLKTLVIQGMPEKVEKLKGTLFVRDQDALAKQKILSCFIQDGTQVRLPKIIDRSKPGFNFPRAYGIPVSRKVSNLNNGLLHLCSLAKKLDGSHTDLRTKIPYAKASIFINKDVNKILFNFSSEYVLFGNNAIPLFGNTETTEHEELPDISPLSPTINIDKTNLYNKNEILAVPPLYPKFPHIIGIVHNTSFYWNQSQKMVRGITSCFLHAATQAYRIYGRTVRNLPQPICVHGICSDENHVTLISYRLNTLNLHGSEGIKNQVWLDGPHKLYEKCDKDDGVVGFNSEVLSKIMAVYAHGAV